MKNAIITVMEITDSHAKLYQAKSIRNSRIVTSCDMKVLVKFTDQEIVEILNGFANQRSIPSQTLITVIPRRFAILKQLTFPSHVDEEIRKMIGFQLMQKVPYALEDLILDYIPIEKKPDGYTKALVVAIHKDVAYRYLNILNQAGLKSDRLILSSQGLVKWYFFAGRKGVSDLRGAVCLMNIDAINCEICFCYQQKLLFSRHISFGAQDIHPEQIEAFAKQIDLSFKAYHKENLGPQLTKIVMVTAQSQVDLLQKKLEENYKLPVEIVLPTDQIPFDKGVNMARLTEHKWASAAAGLGILVGELKGEINFLPKEVHDTTRLRLRKRQWVKSLFIFLLTCALGLSIFQVEHLNKKKILEDIQKKIAEIKPEVNHAEQKIRAVQFVHDAFKNRVLVVDMLAEFYRFIPEDMKIGSIYLSEKKSLIIQGEASNQNSINSFQNNLVRSPLFKEVTLQYATKRMRFREEYTEFKITCQVVLGKEGDS